MEISQQIKKCRAEMKLSQDELAEKIFVSRQTISNWENDKTYPDVKSLLMLSSLFNVSLDTLIKGDIDKMKEKINSEDMKKFKRISNIFGVLFFAMILTPIPLIKFFGYFGGGIWGLLTAVTMVIAFRVEKLKKSYDIQTYREILAFSEGKNLDEMDKIRESGKRPYQKILLAVCSALLMLVVTAVFSIVFH